MVSNRTAAGILEAAAVVLAEHGESVSMADIATASGVGRATLYRYFPTRDLLLRGLIDAALTELRERIADAELDTVPVAEGLARLTRGFLAAGSKYSALASVKKEFIADTAEFDRQLSQPVETLLARGIEDGTLRADLTVAVLVQMYTGLTERAFTMVWRREVGLEQAAALVTTMFLDGATHR
ncbi:MAG TPA: helix-turn-helix domain-containing protein [Pseudonocardiaceae bacterium]